MRRLSAVGHGRSEGEPVRRVQQRVWRDGGYHRGQDRLGGQRACVRGHGDAADRQRRVHLSEDPARGLGGGSLRCAQVRPGGLAAGQKVSHRPVGAVRDEWSGPPGGHRTVRHVHQSGEPPPCAAAGTGDARLDLPPPVGGRFPLELDGGGPEPGRWDTLRDLVCQGCPRRAAGGAGTGRRDGPAPSHGGARLHHQQPEHPVFLYILPGLGAGHLPCAG